MKTVEVYEANIRGVVHASMDAARGFVRDNPMTPEYVVEMLFERGVLEVMPDGSVKAKVQVVTRTDGSAHNVSADYKPHWPRMGVVLDIIKEGPIKLRALQEKLEAKGETHSHWLTLHSLWHLEKVGKIEVDKGSKKYRLKGWAKTAQGIEEDKPRPPTLYSTYMSLKRAVEDDAIAGREAPVKEVLTHWFPDAKPEEYHACVAQLIEGGFVSYDEKAGKYAFLKAPPSPLMVEEVDA